MPGSYAGSTYIGEVPSQFPRRSFKDEFVNPQKQRWLEESNLIPEDKLEHTKSGSTFMEFDDPTAPGGKRYVARKNTDLGDLNQGAGITRSGGDVTYGYTDPSGERKTSKGRVMSFKGATGADEQFVTKAKNYGNKQYTNAEFEQYGPDFEKEMIRRKLKAQEAEAEAKLARDSQRALNEKLALASGLQGIAERGEKNKRDLLKDPANLLPEERAAVASAGLLEKKMATQGKMADREVALLGEANARREGLAKKVDEAVRFKDIPDMSANGERAIRQRNQASGTPEEAWAAGEAAHAADVARLKSLESQGTPQSIREADRMRAADPDLAKVERVLPIRDPVAEEDILNTQVSSFKTDLDKRMQAEDWSLDPWNTWRESGDRFTDLSDDDQRALADQLKSAVLAVRKRVPQMSDQETQMIFRAWLSKQLPNPDDVDVLMRGAF